MAFSPKLQASMQEGGGRHYRGRRPFTPGPWECPACGTPQAGPVERGCQNAACRAGDPTLGRVEQPNVLVRHRDPAAHAPTAAAAMGGARLAGSQAARGASLSDQMQQLTQSRTQPDLPALLDRLEGRVLSGVEQLLAQAVAAVTAPAAAPVTLTLHDLPLAARRTLLECVVATMQLVEQDLVRMPPDTLDLDGMRELVTLLEAPEDYQGLPLTPDSDPRYAGDLHASHRPPTADHDDTDAPAGLDTGDAGDDDAPDQSHGGDR